MGLPGGARQLRSNERAPYCGHDDCEDRAVWKMEDESKNNVYYSGKHYSALTMVKKVPAECDMCRHLDDLTAARSWEEGLNGPLHNVCNTCLPTLINPRNDDWDDQEANEEDI